MADYTVTEKTSVVLISTVSTTPKIVYLNSVGYPGHIVTIKDISGGVNQGSPVVVSTAKGITFADGSISTLLLNPYSYLTVASRTSTSWQILNNFGFLTTLSNAYIEQLTGSVAFVKTLSSVYDNVSTTFADNVTVTKDLKLLGDVIIVGNITVGGVVDLFSTLSVNENINFSTNLTVNGSVAFGSTLFVRDQFTVGNVSTLHSLTVKDSLSVNTILSVSSIQFKPDSNVQNVTMSSVFVSTNLQTAQGISTLKDAFISNSVSTLSTLISQSSISIQGTTTIGGYLDVANNFQTNSLQSFSSGIILKEASISSLSLRGVLSTGDSLFMTGSLLAKEQTNVNDVFVGGLVTTSSLLVTGNVFVSSIVLTGEMNVAQDTILFSSLHTSTLLAGAFSVVGDLNVRGHTSISSFFSTLNNLNIGGSLTVPSSLVVKQASGVVGSISNVLSYRQPVNFSTGTLYVSTNLAVVEDLSILGTAKADILAAPIRIELSTLTLSNAMNVAIETSIPILQSSSNLRDFFPYTILAGEGLQETQTLSPYFLNVNPAANIRNLLQFKSPGFAGEISSIRASSITSTNTLQLFEIGSSNYIPPVIPTSSFLVMTNPEIYASRLNPRSNDTRFYTTSLTFSDSPNSAYFYPKTNLWIAAGKDSQPLKTLQTSSNNGITWESIISGGFYNAATDVTFMISTYQNQYNPIWVATGYENVGYRKAIQYSVDGFSWSDASGTLFYGGHGNRLIYAPTYFNGGVLFCGGNGDTLGPVFGVLYSLDGSNWNNSIVSEGDASLVCQDIAYNPFVGTVIAVGYDSNNVNQMFLADVTNFQSVGWANPYYLDQSSKPIMASYNTICLGNLGNFNIQKIFVLGGDATGGDPLTSMMWTSYLPGLIPLNWQPIQSGGFTVRVNRIIFDSNQRAYFALGESAGGSNIQYSYDAINWYGLSNSVTSPGKYISPGTLRLPIELSNYFVANVETRFETAISSASLIVSSMKASSIQADYFVGDASQLSNANSFATHLGISSLSAKVLAVDETLTFLGSTTANTFTAANRAILNQTDFLSTINTWIATGISFEPTTMTQYTQNRVDWQPTSNTTFEFFGSGIAGNSNAFNPFFVATGGDSIAENTIQYSRNAHDWFSATSGGFEAADEGGIKKGNTVSYLTYLSNSQIANRWLVGGKQNSMASTIFYSDDGSNFFAVPDLQFFGDSAVGCNSIQKIKSANVEAVGLTDLGNFIHSRDGYAWQQAYYFQINSPFLAFGYGYYNSPPFFPPGNYWVAIDSQAYLWFLASTSPEYNWDLTGVFTGLYGLLDIAYSPTGAPNGYWLGITPTQVYYTSTLTSWVAVGNITGPTLQSIAFDTAQQRWFLGASSAQTQQTLWTSIDGSNWNAIQSGGFSTGIASFGQGNALLVATDSLTLAGGAGSFTSLTKIKPQILQVIDAKQPPEPMGAYTSVVLTASNASNVFFESVNGLAYEATQEYPYVAVGDGITPQKTIARSSNLQNWVPATTGGFTVGHDVLYYPPSSIWLATGTAIASTASIQYSVDGGSWFPTNFSGVGGFQGNAIAKMNDAHPTYSYRLIAGGKGASGSNQLYSDDGFTWQNVTTPSLHDTVYGLGAGIIITNTGFSFLSNEGMVAVGSRGTTGKTMSYSTDGLTWTSATGFQFEIAAYDVACGVDMGGSVFWVAVGESSTPGATTIAYSGNGRSWIGLDYFFGGFLYAGYSVVYNSYSNVFIAAGKDEFNNATIQYSGDGYIWDYLSGVPPTNGFLSQQIIGTANSIFGQQIRNFERQPFITMPNFIAYERAEPINYPQTTLRILSTSMILNEALAVNLSSQIILNSNLPFDSVTNVTVEGDVSTVNLIYKGTEPTYRNTLLSSMIVSTLEIESKMTANIFTTPTYDFFLGERANLFSTSTQGIPGDATTIINDILTVSQQGFSVSFPYVRISTNTKPVTNQQSGRFFSELDVGGITATSTVNLSVYKQSFVHFEEPNQIYFSTSQFSIFEGSNPNRITGKNTIYSQPSTISFNSMMTINQSTQRVGLFTSNPLFDFDVRTVGWISNLTIQDVRTETVFFTIQSI